MENDRVGNLLDRDGNGSNNVCVKSIPYMIHADLKIPNAFDFRRHFMLDGRYFYRLHSGNVSTFSRTDTMTGDVLIYNPTDEKGYHAGIQQLHYFKEISEDLGILVYIHENLNAKLKINIALVKVHHKQQRYSVLSRESFYCFSASSISQGTLVQNMCNLKQMICIFTEENDDIGGRDRSCIAFFEVRNDRIRITNILYTKTAIYFPFWHDNYIDGIFEDDLNEHDHHLQRYNINNGKTEMIARDLLEFLNNGEYVSDFCWHQDSLFMFVLTKDSKTVYIQKFDLILRKSLHIDFPIERYALLGKLCRFYINIDSVICYCETTKNDEIQTDRFFRIPLKCPDRLLNYAWVKARDYLVQNKKSLFLPHNFEYLSPRLLSNFDQLQRCSNANLLTKRNAFNSGFEKSSEMTKC